MRILLRLARDVRVISLSQHEYVSRMNEELGRMIGGWTRWSERRSARVVEKDAGA